MKNITKKKIKFVDLIRPDRWSNVGMDFEILRWFVKTGDKYEGVRELLSSQPSCINFDHIKPISSSDLLNSSIGIELKNRFQYALLGFSSHEIKKWRNKFGIDITKERLISGMRANEDSGCVVVEELFNKIFDIPNKRKFRKSPNPNHNAKEIKNVEIIVFPENYLIRIKYSLKYKDNYGWYFDIYSDKREYFYDYLKRVKKIIEKKTVVIKSTKKLR